MDFNIKSGNPEKQRTACVIVGIFSTRRLSNPAKAIDKASKQHISTLIRRGDMDGKKGQSLLLHNVPGVMADRILLIGCGKEREVNDRSYRTIIENSISEVFIGSLDINPLVNGRGVEELEKAGIKVHTNILSQKCNELNKYFFNWIKTKRPYVIAKVAQTKDCLLYTSDAADE